MSDSEPAKDVVNTRSLERRCRASLYILIGGLGCLAAGLLWMTFFVLSDRPWSLAARLPFPVLICLGFILLAIGRAVVPKKAVFPKAEVAIHKIGAAGLLLVALACLATVPFVVSLTCDLPKHHVSHPTLALIVAVIAILVQIAFIVLCPIAAWRLWRKARNVPAEGTTEGPSQGHVPSIQETGPQDAAPGG